MIAAILAGGKGTRLKSTFDGPKCLAPIRGRAFVEFQFDWLRDSGVRDVVMCLGHKASEVIEFVSEGRKWGLRVKYSVEREPLGTGGALKNAASLLKAGRFLAMNGDTYLNADLDEMAVCHDFHRAEVTMAIGVHYSAPRIGAVETDKTDRVLRVVHNKDYKKGFVSAGVYMMERTVLDRIPEGPCSLEDDILPKLSELYVYDPRTPFLDIGTPRSFYMAQGSMRGMATL